MTRSAMKDASVMTRTRTRTSAKAARGCLLAAFALLAGAAPAGAAAWPAAQDSWLYLTVAPQESRTAAPASALLLCDPPRGHARAAEACAELAAADGHIGAVRHRDAHCPMVYAPVTAHAHGQWRGRPVDYTETFPNRCVMEARTGSVFAPADPPQRVR